MSGRMLFSVAGAVFLFTFLCCPVTGAYASENGLLCPSCSLEPTLHAGVVFEFAGHDRQYRGFELVGRYAPAPWMLSARYRIDSYRFDYFGMTWDTFQQVIHNQTLTGTALTAYDAKERRTESDVAAGYSLASGRITLSGGGRLLDLDNDFSSMTAVGPLFRFEGNQQTAIGKFELGANIAWFTHTSVRNMRGYYEFVRPEGERTISYLGEPRYEIGWTLLASPFSGSLKRLSFGYDGSTLGLKYNNRYYHGLAIRAVF